jgi:2-polyprenyl-6-methoxyphenol hydroxylase-like FAD-dependent oxidoreductase
MESTATTVCIVGAGPSGLVTAIGLARSGVPFILVDADDGPTVESRALNVHPGAMEIFEDLGIADDLMKVGIRVRMLRVSVGGRKLAEFPMDKIGVKYPFSLHVRQQTTETALYKRLGELGHSPRSGHTVTDVREVDGEYEVSGRTDAGQAFSVRARYVVGADGLPSIVRKSMDIGFPGKIYEQAFLIADVELDDPLPDSSVSYVHPSRHGLLFYAPLSGGNWRLVVSVISKDGRKPDPPTEDELDSHLERRGPGTLRVRRMVSSSSFIFQHGIADDFVRGGVILIGDAAHTHSPAGGMGMNTGVQDGYDLAATLAAIERGADAAEALAGFDRRRRAAGLEVVRFSDKIMVLITLASPLTHVMRTLFFSAVGLIGPLQRRIARMTSCTTRSPWNTGAPELPSEPVAAIDA